MGGRVLLLCSGEQGRWKSPAPKQLIRVVNDEVLIARTVRQCRTRFSGEDPLLISHLPALRRFSRNAICPRRHRYIIETLLSSYPLWGDTWTIVLLGDVLFSDTTINTIIDNREKFECGFYGTHGEIYALSFTDKIQLGTHLDDAITLADQGVGRGKLWDLYYSYLHLPLDESGNGRVVELEKECNQIYFNEVNDGTRDFDTLEQYSQWYKLYEHNEVKI